MNEHDQPIALPIRECLALVAFCIDLRLVNHVSLVRQWADREILNGPIPRPWLIDLCMVKDLETARQCMDDMTEGSPFKDASVDETLAFLAERQTASESLWQGIWHTGHVVRQLRPVDSIQKIIDLGFPCCAPPDEKGQILWDEIYYDFPSEATIRSGVLRSQTAQLLKEIVFFLEDLRDTVRFEQEQYWRTHPDRKRLMHRLADGEDGNLIDVEMGRGIGRAIQEIDWYQLIIDKKPEQFRSADAFADQHRDLLKLVAGDMRSLLERVRVDWSASRG